MPCPICDQKPMNCDCSESERRMHAEIEELEEKASRWIPVGERLPKEFESVVVRGVFAGDGGVYIGQYCGRGWMMQDGRAWSHCWTPSHWMPLPEPPESK